MIVDRCDDLEAVLLVESGRLKGEGHQHNLRAAPASRLPLGGVELLCAESEMPFRFLDPELP
jgi:hypothetical protein